MSGLISRVTVFVASHIRAILVIAVVAVIGVGSYLGTSHNASATLTVHRGAFSEEVNVAGKIVPVQSVDLGFASSGRVSSVYTSSREVGYPVSQGTILAEVENGDLSAKLSEAQADLGALMSGTRSEELAVSRSSVESAKTALMLAIQNAYAVADDAVNSKVDTLFNKADALRMNPPDKLRLTFTTQNDALRLQAQDERNALTQTFTAWSALVKTLTAENALSLAPTVEQYLGSVIRYLSDVNVALAQAVPDQSTTATTLATYASTVATARTNVTGAATSFADAYASLSNASKTLVLKEAGPTADALAAQQAVVNNASAALAKTRIVAPFDGIVTRMDAKVGQTVSPGDPLVSMQVDAFEVETYLPEVSVASVAKGNPAVVTLDAYGSATTFDATVVSVDPAETVKDGVPTYKTMLSFTKADPRIRSGMTANVRIVTGTLSDAIVVPSGAIGTDPEGQYVQVQNGSSLEKRRVTTGRSPALGKTLVLSGLEDGEVIALTP